MKTRIVLFLVGISSILQAQELDTVLWCPSGARWIYKLFSPTSQLFEEFVFVKDTVIDSESCKLINKFQIQFLCQTCKIVQPAGQLYLRNSNDSMFFYNNAKFNFMYRFMHTDNDTFRIANCPSILCGGDLSYENSDTLTTYGTINDTIGTRIFRKQFVSSLTGRWRLDAILKNIGSLAYIHPLPGDSCPNHPQSEYYLVCYQDSIRGRLEITDNPLIACSEIETSILEPSTNNRNRILVYPNPASEYITIQTEDEEYSWFNIRDIAGKVIDVGKVENNVIYLGNLPTGLYLLEVGNTKDRAVLKLIKTKL